MPNAPQADFAIHALASALPASGEPPEWITIFPRLGEIVTRDRRRYIVDAAALIARFEEDAIDLPVDVNHSTDMAAFGGRRSDAVGWISQLRVAGDALQGKVEWLDEGRTLLAAKKYRFVSPSFHHTPDGRTTWLKAVALVTAPALGRQPALAAASSRKETIMEKLASALGVTAEATEAAMLAALSASFVAKTVHDETLAQLAATAKELSDIKAAGRKAQIDALLDGALKEKKILPAERDHYAQLCASDAGLESVKALLAAKSPVLAGSGLDKKEQPEGGATPSPAQLAAMASKMVEKGEAADFVSAVAALDAKYQAAA